MLRNGDTGPCCKLQLLKRGYIWHIIPYTPFINFNFGYSGWMIDVFTYFLFNLYEPCVALCNGLCVAQLVVWDNSLPLRWHFILSQLWQWNSVHCSVSTSVVLSSCELFVDIDSNRVIVSYQGSSSSHRTWTWLLCKDVKKKVEGEMWIRTCDVQGLDSDPTFLSQMQRNFISFYLI